MKKVLKRAMAFVLVIIMVVTMAPLMDIDVSAAYTESQVSGVKNSVISNSSASRYVDTMMGYYLKTNDRLMRNLNDGKSVVFFFDGCSDNVFGNGFNYKTNHMSAYVAVVKLSGGVPKIVYENENSSTIPDNPRLVNNTKAGNDGTPVPTVVDGIHNITITNHLSSYAALHVCDSGSSVNVIRCTSNSSYSSTSSGINIHARSFNNTVGPTTYSSTGCFNVGVQSPTSEYNNFMYAITGISNARNNRFGSTGKDVGVVVVDRYMYRDTLNKIYNDSSIVNTITQYSQNQATEANKKSGNSLFGYLDSCINQILDAAKNLINTNSNSGYVYRMTSSNGISFIKIAEGGPYTTAYPDSAGVWTIGYGHTGGVYKGMTISEAQAEQYLRNDLKTAETAVNNFMKQHNRYISQEQFDALVSFTFNVGSGWTTNSGYNIYKYMSTGNHTDQQVKETFGSWVNAGGKRLQGLVTRRAKEAALYLYGTYDGTGGSSNNSGTNNNVSNNHYNPSAGYGTGYYKITASSGVNVRSGAGTNYGRVSGLAKGTQVAITKVNGNWGQCSAGWICLDYASWIGNLEPVINVPATPSLKLTSSANMPTGKAVTVTWASAADAVCYDIYLKNSNGTVCQQSIGNTGNSVAFTINDAGKYTVTAVSRNTKYTSSTSNTINVTAHSPSIVTFKDWDGTVLSKQSIAYGSSATAPSNPSRYGWTFKKWVGSYSNVTSNQTVTAQYERNVYTITFVDEEGEVIGSKQKVEFEGAATAPTYTAPEGYTFLGWDKEFNYIESNMTIHPVIKWANEDLPVQILSTTTAVRESTGYTVNVSVRNNPDSVTDGRIIVALKTEDGKLLSMTESAAFHLKISANKTIEVFMPYDQAAVIAEIYVVEKFSTAIPISAVSSITIDQGTAWTNWSTTPNPDDAYQAEKRTEYRYRTKSTTTSSNSSLSGWTKYNTTSKWGDYGSWSSWTDSKITASDSRQVETRTVVASTNYKTVYHYYRYATSEHASSGSYAQSSSYPNRYSYTFDSPLETTTAINGYTRYKWWYNGTNWHGLYASSPYTTQEVVSYNYKTQYRYRDRSQIYTYYYYKWSDWSAWSTTATTGSDTKQVETRTTYRYLANDPSLVADNTGVIRTIAGKVDAALAGEQATLFIYKVDEASDFTNEYVGQTVIGNDGSYSFTFKLREEPSIKTGDYTVTLGIEGTSAAIYLDPIEAPKPQYTVTYKDWDGTVISTQKVTEGENATMPSTDPEREGYDFICWNDTATNIKDDLIVSPVYRIKTYAVVFVDWTKESVVLQHYEHGQPLVPPEMEATDDSYIVGWDAIIDGTTTVTDDMVVTAKYEKKTYTVTFLDETGELLNEYIIPYGGTVESPKDLDNENVELFGWVSDGDMENVTEDLVVVPVYKFKETVATPTVNIGTGEYTKKQTITLECDTDNAVIYYTLNGADPLVEGIEYTGPFEITTSTELKFAACALEMNDSASVRKLIAINDGSSVSKHIVQFVGNGAETDYDYFFVDDGNTLGFIEADFAIEGYVFTGAWYGEEFSTEWNFANDKVTDSMVICLTWVPETYEITFIGYDDEVLDVQQVEYLGEAVPPQCDEIEGYVFAGFDCDDFVVYGDKIITAKYIPEDEYVAVTLDKVKYRLLSGTSFELTATLSNVKDNTTQTVLWCSSNEDVVKVNDDGFVTGVSSGTAYVYAVCNESGSIASCEVTVVANIDEKITISSDVEIGFDSEEQIRGISTKKNTLSEVRKMFENDSLVFIDINGYVLEDADLVGTGTRVRLMNGDNIVDEKIVVVTGDMNGDGKINNRDASMIVRYLVDKEVANLAQLTAIDVNGDGYVNNRDASMVSRYLVGKETI